MHQDRYWWDVHGRRWPLELMEFDYLLNVLHFLEEEAGRLYQLEISRAIISDGDVAAPKNQGPASWVRSTALHQAIKRRILDWPHLDAEDA